METERNLKGPNSWKELDLTAKYAQLNTLRKLACDISFNGISEQLNSMVKLRINNLSEDLVQLYKLESASVELPKPV